MSEPRPVPCYREQTNGVYFTKERHRIDCADPECRGCVTCPGRHCTARKSCTWHLDPSEQTCGRCIGEARTELGWVVSLSALLLTQALGDGLESEAANLAGPATDPEAWSWRKAAARAGGAWHLSLIEDDDEHHPMRVLGTWERMIREDYGHDTDAPMTLAGAADYLNRNLHRIANDDEQDFPLLKRELKKCRQHLEAVIHNDTRRDRGAPCPTCRSAHRADCEDPKCRGCVIVRLERHYSHWCADEGCQQRFHFTDDTGDVWRCPRDASHWWTAEGYARDVVAPRRSA